MIERYARQSGRDARDIRQYRAIAQFRLAVVFRQIFRRFRDSGEINVKAEKFDVLADNLLDFTLDVMAGWVD
jgi:aminoglycoside phosphotransferase (APT) family kinase protein